MSQGISATLDLIQNRLEAISPKTDAHQNFVVIGDRSGLTAQLDQRNGSTRICEIESQVFLLMQVKQESQALGQHRLRLMLDMMCLFKSAIFKQ